MIIKNPPFEDGNKRIATYMFNVYLTLNNREVSMSPLFATQIAESKPENKELIIDLIIAIIQNSKKTDK
jgi:prophage maintenance system killer protein